MPSPPTKLRGDDEVDATTALIVNGTGILVVLAGIYRSLSTGALVTRREHENRMADKDAQIADKDAQIVMWRAASDTEKAQTAELLEHSRLTVQLMQSLEARSRGEKQ